MPRTKKNTKHPDDIDEPASTKPVKKTTKKRAPKTKKASNDGLVPMLLSLADMLPPPYNKHGKDIVGIFGVAFIAIIVIYVLGAFVVGASGHAEWNGFVFGGDVLAVGTAAVAAIVKKAKGAFI